MKYYIRIIVWSILIIIFLLSGGYGLYQSINTNKIPDIEKSNLDNIINQYNTCEYVENLKNENTLSKAYLKKKKLIIEYSNDNIDSKYEFEYKNNSLYISIDKDDQNGWVITKLLVDAISTTKKRPETKTFETFENIRINKVSNDESISFSFGEDKTDITIRTDISLKILEYNTLISNSELYKDLDKIRAFNYNYSNENIIIKLYKETNSRVLHIAQTEKLNIKTYNLFINLLSNSLSSEEMEEINNNYFTIFPEESITFSKYNIINKKLEDFYSLTIYISTENEDEEKEILKDIE